MRLLAAHAPRLLHSINGCNGSNGEPLHYNGERNGCYTLDPLHGERNGCNGSTAPCGHTPSSVAGSVTFHCRYIPLPLHSVDGHIRSVTEECSGARSPALPRSAGATNSS